MNFNQNNKLDLIYQLDPKHTEKGCLYLGSVYDTDRLMVRNQERITAVLTVGDGPECSVKLDPKSYKLLQISAYDRPNFNLKQHFETAIAFISENLQSTNVFVHCFAGVSRSASVVIAFLMKTQRLSLESAFDHVKVRRPIIQPNQGFMNQLKEYSQQLQNNTDEKSADV